MDVPGLVRCAQSLEEWAPDYAQVLDELAGLLVRVAMKQAVSEFEGDDLYAPELLERLAKALAPEDVQLFYQTAIVGRRDLALAPDPRTGFEMTLLRMIAFRPGNETAQPRAVGAVAGRTGAASAAAAAAGPKASAVAQASGSGDRRQFGQGPINAASDTPDVAGAAATGAAAEAGSWMSIVSQLELSGAARQLASHCVLVGRQGAVVRLALDPRNKFVRTPSQEDKLAQALSRHFGEPVRLEFTTASPELETPAQAGQRASQQELDSARRAFEADPGVQGLRERFGATLLPETVRPVK
jgi:DNA polymerase-3 subunit gamma/tau